ncbi:MAG: DUF2520 domain-containing protein [Actinomycetota bacterium]
MGGSFVPALRGAGHRVVAELHRGDDQSGLARATVIVMAVPDDALDDVVRAVATHARPDALLIHTCGLEGVEPLRAHGHLVAAIHPASPVARPGQSFRGTVFGVTCADDLREWCASFVADLGGRTLFIAEPDRALYHAALVMASNFAVSLAGDAADLLGSVEVLIPLLRATVENVAALGPDAALTGPVVRGDAGTVRAHLRALPAELVEMYVANARRALARAVSSGRLDAINARAVQEALEEALVP